MSNERFDDFFRAAFAGERTPFDYQRRLACGEDGKGRECASLLIDVPTGCGKTAAVVLAWLWNRFGHPDAEHRARWPRRLVYCLPMRTLVEQTHRECRRWLRNIWRERAALGLSLEAVESLRQLRLQGPVLLMGGTPKNSRRRPQWDLYPGRDAILIGTQDMLLSRALNRGYGLSRYRWPMAFGLLNHDCLWVLDETQLMGVGVETSAQLDGFRHRAELGAPTRTFTWWMSATLATAQLETVDHPRPAGGWLTVELSERDKTPGSPVQTRRASVKRLDRAPVALTPGDKDDYAKKLAGFVQQQHDATVAARQAGQPAVLTLVVLNRVARAREVYQALQKRKVPADKLALVHSRFRPEDRRRHEKVLFAKDTDRIVVATQAVEAGVDVSARTLVTELAAWPSLVQRFGRCNREGEWPGGTEVFWIDVRLKDDKDNLPYTTAELADARKLLEPLDDVGLGTLHGIAYAPEPPVRSVIRRKDLLDLFDTTADLLGHDLDISRYVRDAEDTDAQVFWRDFVPDGKTPVEQPAPTRDELCRVSLADFRKFFDKSEAMVWDGLETKSWQTPRGVRPGQTYLLPVRVGGYEDGLGWTGRLVAKDNCLTPHPPPRNEGAPPPPYDGNSLSFDPKRWVLLDDHTSRVVAMLEEVLLDTLPLTKEQAAALRDAASWHDVGKGHAVFQTLLRAVLIDGDDAPEPSDPEILWAKSAGTKRFVSPERKGFRHELASALAWLQQTPDHTAQRDLTAFLIAAHHGKVRLSIRSLPNEAPRPPGPDQLCARGVWQDDPLPPAAFPEAARGSLPADGFKLDLGYMKMGDDERRGPSWLARMLALRDSSEFGPFRLAYLETLLRAADSRASAEEADQP